MTAIPRKAPVESGVTTSDMGPWSAIGADANPNFEVFYNGDQRFNAGKRSSLSVSVWMAALSIVLAFSAVLACKHFTVAPEVSGESSQQLVRKRVPSQLLPPSEIKDAPIPDHERESIEKEASGVPVDEHGDVRSPPDAAGRRPSVPVKESSEEEVRHSEKSPPGSDEHPAPLAEDTVPAKTKFPSPVASPAVKKAGDDASPRLRSPVKYPGGRPRPGSLDSLSKWYSSGLSEHEIAIEKRRRYWQVADSLKAETERLKGDLPWSDDEEIESRGRFSWVADDVFD